MYQVSAVKKIVEHRLDVPPPGRSFEASVRGLGCADFPLGTPIEIHFNSNDKGVGLFAGTGIKGDLLLFRGFG